MHEFIIFLNGSLLAVLACMSWYTAHKFVAAEKVALQKTSDLETLLKTIVEEHNKLTETIAAVDRKASDTSLKTDMLAMRRSNATQ